MFLQVRFQICCYLYAPCGEGVVNLDIPYFSLLSLVALLLEHNVDEKSMQNIDVRIHVKLGVKLPIEILSRSTPQPPFPYQKKITHSKVYSPAKNFDSGRKF